MKTKILSLLLALTLLFSFAACTEDPDSGSGDDSSNGTDAVSDTEPIADDRTNLEIALDNAGNIDLEKTEIRILSPDPGKHFYNWGGAEENEIFYEEPSSESLPNAIYNRNLKVSEALGIEIVPVWAGDTGDISNIVRTNDAAGDKEYYDVILTRLDHAISNASNGFLLNFHDITSMNLENGWWDRHIIDTFTIYDNYLYVLSGDINFYDDYAVQTMFFNKELISDNGLEDPYQLVRDGKWTIDKMIAMSEDAHFDYNGDGVYEPGIDILGIGDNYDAVCHYIFCYGLKMSENDENGVPQVVPANDLNTAALDDIYTLFTNSEISSTSMSASQFMDDKFLFYGEMLGSIPMFRDMETDFGIIPMPKGDESVEGYRAYVSNGWTTVYSIPSVFTPAEAYETGIILECLSAASKDEVTPALYNQLLESKYIRDEESKEMLTYILDSKVYDWAGDLSWASSLRNAYNGVLTNGPSAFTTALTANTKSLNKQLEKLVENLLGE